jgi:hypothetical protein
MISRSTILARFLFLAMCGCGPVIQGGKVSGDVRKFLSSVPVIGVEIKNYGILPWQKERMEAVEEKLKKCLPPILDRFCGAGGCKYVYSPDDPEAFRQKHKLKVKIKYERSSHFMDGFVIIATHEMRDSADLETIFKYRYTWEPRTNLYFETTKKFCDELAGELKEIK